jgi:hypothetical protein
MTEDFSAILELISTINRWKDKNGHAHLVLEPVLAEDTLAEYEELYGIRLPEEYRYFITEIGNGIKVQGLQLSYSSDPYILYRFYPDHTLRNYLPNLAAEFFTYEDAEKFNQEDYNKFESRNDQPWKSLIYKRRNDVNYGTFWEYLSGCVQLSYEDALVVNSSKYYGQIFEVLGSPNFVKGSFCDWLTIQLDTALSREKDTTLHRFPKYSSFLYNHYLNNDALEASLESDDDPDLEIMEHLSSRLLKSLSICIDRPNQDLKSFINIFSFRGYMSISNLKIISRIKAKKINEIEKLLTNHKLDSFTPLDSIAKLLFVDMTHLYHKFDSSILAKIYQLQFLWTNKLIIHVELHNQKNKLSLMKQLTDHINRIEIKDYFIFHKKMTRNSYPNLIAECLYQNYFEFELGTQLKNRTYLIVEWAQEISNNKILSNDLRDSFRRIAGIRPIKNKVHKSTTAVVTIIWILLILFLSSLILYM